MTPSPRSLRQDESAARRDLLQSISYDVSLDLTDDRTFTSRTRIRFTSDHGETFLDVKPLLLLSVLLDGSPLDPAQLDGGRFPLTLDSGEHELVVEAVMTFRNDGEGMHQHFDPADGQRYVYQMSFMDAAPNVFACFDQPDLKAPYTLHVRAPHDWTVIGNAPGQEVERGTWEFDTTPPLSTYFVTLVAGPYHVLTDVHDGIPLGLSARASLAAALDTEADELFTLTKQCFDEFHRLFGIRYPFGNYHQAFVPEFNAGAMENPGCVTFRVPLVFSSRVTRGARIQRATTVAHEMAHQWFGNLVTPRWWDDLWLNESFAEYMGNRVTADVTQYDDAWVHNAYSRRQWGLVADQRPSTHPVAGNGAKDARTALQNFDGISYAKGSSILKQLNARMGDTVFLAGVVDHLERHRFGNASMVDLLESWRRAGATGLDDFVDSWLRTAGVDTLAWDRAEGRVISTAPTEAPSIRAHSFTVASLRDGTWHADTAHMETSSHPVRAGADAVVLDPYEETWAATLIDRGSLAALVGSLRKVDDPLLRAGAWNSVRTSVHRARLHPQAVIDLVEDVMETEENDAAISTVVPWAIRTAALAPDSDSAHRRLNETMWRRTRTAAPGSALQLAAYQSDVATAHDPALLRARLAGDVPAGIELDLDLRWAHWVRLATLGATDAEELDDTFAAVPTARARIEHARARASLPDPAAKLWAWERFTGSVDVSNYELEAAGLGMWREGQRHVTDPYAELYLVELARLPSVHSGWVLGTAVRSFFPMTNVDEEFLTAVTARTHDGELDATVRRNLVDLGDELSRRASLSRLARTSLGEGLG